MTRPAPMENTVRPFAPRDFVPAIVNYPPPIPEGVVECKLGGAGGTTTSFSLGTTGFITIKAETMKEASRKSTKVRVENPDDPSQFVEFCRADSITLKRTQTAPPDPARTSSYDYSGGYHFNNYDQNAQGQPNTRQYSFQYPNDTTCAPRTPPKGGVC